MRKMILAWIRKTLPDSYYVEDIKRKGGFHHKRGFRLRQFYDYEYGSFVEVSPSRKQIIERSVCIGKVSEMNESQDRKFSDF